MHPSRKTQIAYLKAEKALTKVSSKYANFANVFSPKLTIKFPKNLGIKNYVMKLVDNWQPSYSPIYNLGQVDLEILKTYIENNLTNGFIKPSKSPIRIVIFFDKKLDKSL